MFAESEAFNLDAIRKQAVYEFDRVLSGAPFSNVWVPSEERHVSLMDYAVTTPSGKKLLSEIRDLKFAFVDLDGDTVEELIIDCGEILVLHFFVVTVYLYPLSVDQAYQLNTDGTFAWKSAGETREYGERRITGYYRTEELWKIVNDGEPNAEYYVGGERVTKEQLQKYLTENPRTAVSFLSLDQLWGGMLSPLKAIDVGKEYWSYLLIEDEYGIELKFQSEIYGDDVPKDVYIVQLVRYDSHHNSQYIDEIWVDKISGEGKSPFGAKG